MINDREVCECGHINFMHRGDYMLGACAVCDKRTKKGKTSPEDKRCMRYRVPKDTLLQRQLGRNR